MLRNPAYKGVGLFRQDASRAAPAHYAAHSGCRGGVVPRETSASHERPREDWIEIPVPALVSEDTFALAAGTVWRPTKTARPPPHDDAQPRARTGQLPPSAATRSIGPRPASSAPQDPLLPMSGFRHISASRRPGLRQPTGAAGPPRPDRLDRSHPTCSKIPAYPDRTRSPPCRPRARPIRPRRRKKRFERELLRISKSIERLLTAYQEDLLSLDELRQRMPDLRTREQTSEAELQAIADQSAERAACLRLAETVADFLSRLRSSAGTLNVPERQRVVRLLVKEILVGDDKIVIRHSIPLPANPPGGPYPNGDLPGPGQDQSGSYLLRSGRDHRSLRGADP